jgi:hypothetical protein
MIPAQGEPFKIPRELERRPPRSVRRRAATLGCGVIAGRCLGLIFALVALFLLLRVPLTIAIVTHGESHSGVVMKTWSGKSGRRGTITYHLRYAYEAAGQTHSDSRTVSQEQYDQLSSYPPALPLDVKALSIGGTYFDEMFLPGEWLWGPVWLAVLIAAIGNGIAFVILYYVWIVPWRHKLLCRDGKPVFGRIVKMHTTTGKTTSYYLDYEFDHPGLGIRTATVMVQSEAWHRAQVGEPVSVLCYPHRKRPTVIYEYGDFECL